MKQFLKYTGIIFLLALIGCYFFFAERISAKEEAKEVCKSIKVVILDSARNRFINKDDIIDIMDGFMGNLVGKKKYDINLAVMEEVLNKRSMIRRADACISIDGNILINVTQRKPILRIESSQGGFYIDDTKFIFPLADNFTSYVPIVSGNIPIEIYEGYRGKAIPGLEDWINGIYCLGLFLDKNPFWNAQIEQIYIDAKGDIYLCPRVGEHKIIFGDCKNIENKFNRLQAFYENVIPSVGWNAYNVINLKYKDQIVCKIRKNNKKVSNTI